MAKMRMINSVSTPQIHLISHAIKKDKIHIFHFLGILVYKSRRVPITNLHSIISTPPPSPPDISPALAA